MLPVSESAPSRMPDPVEPLDDELPEADVPSGPQPGDEFDLDDDWEIED